jgi:adenine-specific DNA-methyltransferase
MYPRLRLLQRLLTDDGAIFISVDDNELTNLKLLCDETFGSTNFITTFIWRKVDSPNDNKVPITPDHEYILSYAKNKNCTNFVQMKAPDIVNAYGQTDETGRRYRDRLLKKNGRSSLRRDRPTMYFALEAPDGSKVYPTHDNGDEARWAMSRDGIDRNKKNGTLIWKQRIRFGVTVWEPYTREYAPDDPTRPFPSIWYDLPTMRQAKRTLREIFSTTDLFDTPKPNELIERILSLTDDKESIILDSFAGSGTTAHAVLGMNKADSGNRKFILIEMEEYVDSITAERVKRVINGYADKPGTGGGFDYYTLGVPLMYENGNINNSVDVSKIRDYIWYMETKQAAQDVDIKKHPYLLGETSDTAYYFYYEKDRTTPLDTNFLTKVNLKAGRYVIYADECILSDDMLDKYNISFKKIPRDIAKL